MNLGIFLPIGSSFIDLKKSGQDQRFINYYLKEYSKKFEKIYIFSYKKEKIKLSQNCILVKNSHNLHRFIYCFLFPFLNWGKINNINVVRVMQMTGVMPAILAKIFFKKPFLFTYGYNYVSFSKMEKRPIRAKLLEWLEKIAFKFTAGVFVTTKRNKFYLSKKYPQVKLFYLPNFIDMKRFRKTKSIFSHQLLTILFVGRLEQQKNLDSLIKAVALIKNKYKIKLTLIGQGKMKTQLMTLAKKNKVNLKIITKVSHDKLVKHYHKADIFCLPSFLEGQPKVLLEAMACGLPCLVGNYPGAKEFKNKKEVLLTGFKVKDMSRNLELLIKDSDLRKTLSLNARKKIKKDFNIERLLDKEIRILKHV